MVTAKRKPAQEDTQNYPKQFLGPRSSPQWGVLLSLGLFLGRLPFGGDQFLTTFLAYVLGRPKTIILPFLGFGLSRGHDLYNGDVSLLPKFSTRVICLDRVEGNNVR